MVQPIHYKVSLQQETDKKNAPSADIHRGKVDTAQTKNTMDTVTLTKNPEPAATYSPGTVPDQLADKSYEMLRKLVTTMLKEQGIDFQVSTGEATVDISIISQEEARELISDDGYFGVEQTSDRIVDFAIAAAGGDRSKLVAIKEGVEHGFNEAREIFGGSLPDISYDTLDAIMEKLDAWAGEADSKEA